ncbi:MAG TPA: hypothetical protein VF062_20170 [Candidatus Limnocylindrales bacterium]
MLIVAGCGPSEPFTPVAVQPRGQAPTTVTIVYTGRCEPKLRRIKVAMPADGVVMPEVEYLSECDFFKRAACRPCR